MSFLSELFVNIQKLPNVRRWVEAYDFFMMQEYNNVKANYEKPQRRIQMNCLIRSLLSIFDEEKSKL